MSDILAVLAMLAVGGVVNTLLLRWLYRRWVADEQPEL